MARKKLKACNMKDELWNTLLDLRGGKIEASKADSIAGQSREILRTINTQLRILQQAKQNVTDELVGFNN